MGKTKQALIQQLQSDPSGGGIGSKERIELAKWILHGDPEKVENGSKANWWIIGYLNKLSQKRRVRAYEKKKAASFSGVVIVSEGDSWFQFPILLKDIIDWLRLEQRYNIYSLGYAADWLVNMLGEKQYLKVIQAEEPTVFLISGGGNDVVGSGRLARLVHPFSEVHEKDPKSYLNEDYYCLLKIFELQYRELFEDLRTKCKGMQIITQGYAYAVPWDPKPWEFWKFWKGPFFKRPLGKRDITDPKTQRAIATKMIDDFNEMLIRVANQCSNVHHIDSRNMFSDHDWFDELHLKSRAFSKVADQYKETIDRITQKAHSATVE